MQFDDEENKGTLTFLGCSKIRGTMEGGFMERFTFVGVQDQKSLRRVAWVERVEAWREEWRGINDHT